MNVPLQTHLKDFLVIGQHHVPGISEEAYRSVPRIGLDTLWHQVSLHAMDRQLLPVLVNLLQFLLSCIVHQVLILIIEGFLQPPPVKLGVKRQGLGVLGHIAHQALLALNVNGHVFQDLLQGLSPPENHRFPFSLSVGLGDQAGPLKADLDLRPVAGVHVNPLLASVKAFNRLDAYVLF